MKTQNTETLNNNKRKFNSTNDTLAETTNSQIPSYKFSNKRYKPDQNLPITTLNNENSHSVIIEDQIEHENASTRADLNVKYNDIKQYGPLINTLMTNSAIVALLSQMPPTKYTLKFNYVLILYYSKNYNSLDLVNLQNFLANNSLTNRYERFFKESATSIMLQLTNLIHYLVKCNS